MAMGLDGGLPGQAFLVVGRGRMDEVPLGLFNTIEKARAFASGVTEDDILAVAKHVCRTDMSEVLNVVVVPFIDGRPVLMEIVQDFDT